MDPNRPPYQSPPPYDSQPPYGNYDPYYPYGPRPNNGKAIAALVLGISSIVTIFFLPGIGIILGILGVIFGILALKEISRRMEGGRGMAISGLICAIIGFLMHVALIAFVVFAIIMSIGESTDTGTDYWSPTFQQDGTSDFY
ncbi:DUF4190 domain-containing protein [Paenibacillus kandeliae]|uniref:DUF4190 domain-containing protein n=1 Tax=Paenibacillus kandeliae TaxID=3231269 RepID=UPI00345A1F2E